MGFDLPAVARAAAEGRLALEQGGLARMMEAGIAQSDLVESLPEAEVTECELHGCALPTALLLCPRDAGPLHAAIAWDAQAQHAYCITIGPARAGHPGSSTERGTMPR